MRRLHQVFAIAALAASACPAGAGSPFAVLSATGEVLATGDVITGLTNEVSINAVGQVAFGATLSLGGVSGSGVVHATPTALARRVTFPPSTQRLYSSIQINDAQDIIVRDRFAGSPPVFFARTWNASGAFNVLADTNGGPLSSIIFTALANEGSSSFVALTNGGSTSGLYLNPNGVPDNSKLLYTFTGAGARPAIGDGYSVVMRTGNPGLQQLRHTLGDPTVPGFLDQTISSVLMTRIGATPGISDDGSLAVFYAEDPAGPGVFVRDLKSGMPAVRVASIGDAFNTTQTGRSVAAISADTKIAVERISSAIGQQYRILFSATDDVGESALIAARFSTATNTAFDRTAIVRTGAAVGLAGGTASVVPTSVWSGDSLTTSGRLAIGVASAGGQQVIHGALSGLTKYKQAQDGNVFNVWGSDANGMPVPINPNASTVSVFSQRGCFLASVASVATHYGFEVNPIDVRDLALDQTILVGNDLFLTGVMKTVGLRLDDQTRLRSLYGMHGLQDIASQVGGGGAVLLRVPTKAFLLNGTDTTLHAIVAYGLDPSLPQGATVEAKHIFVSDPGYTQPYKTDYAGAYTPGEQLVNVTLQDVFDRMNDTSTLYDFDAEDWFDDRSFVRLADMESLDIPAALFTYGRGNAAFFEVVQGATTGVPGVGVNSPVDLVLIDQTTGTRYVSSVALLQPGDVLLEKAFGEIGGDEIDGIETTLDTFPHYALMLPDMTLGHSFEVAIHGLADGSYRLSFDVGSGDYVAVQALTGQITAGQVIAGVFTVTPVPEPASGLLLIVGAGLLGLWHRRRQRRV